MSEKEKKAAYVTSRLNDLIQNLPDSAEAKQLKVKTEADIKACLDNAKKMMDAQKEQARLEKGMEMIDSRIVIIKKREELKKWRKTPRKTNSHTRHGKISNIRSIGLPVSHKYVFLSPSIGR
ncbi:MAG: hypothetical protein WCS43_08340 [Verrucomicrobiota bacterium]